MSDGTFAKLPNWLLRRPDVSSTAKLLYGRLLQYQGKNSTAWPGITALAVEIGRNRTQVMDNLAALERLGLLHVEHRAGYRASNHYKLLTSGEDATGSENATSGETATRTSGEDATSLVAKTPPQEIKKRSGKKSNPSPNGDGKKFVGAFHHAFEEVFKGSYSAQRGDYVVLNRWLKSHPEASPESFASTCRQVWTAPYPRKSWLTLRGICSDWSSALASLKIQGERNGNHSGRITGTPDKYAGVGSTI
jgi:hypothetical protein